MRLPIVVIVGRPNVGKSSLFNRVLGRREAVVADREGVTRDRHYQRAIWNARNFEIVDTGGFIPRSVDSIDDQVRRQIETAVDEADHVVFVIDAKSGVTDLDLQFARILLRKNKPTTLLANKAESPSVALEAASAWSLGFDKPFPVSALQGAGVADALDHIVAALPEFLGELPAEGAIRIAVLGRPNAGKSTLINALVGEERQITSEVPGTTRDSIDTPFVWEGRRFILTDTAGLRKKARVEDEVEYYSNLRTLEAIRRSDVCILLLDATLGMEIQDFRIAELIEKEGKGMIVVLNKWDLMDAGDKTFDHMIRELVYRAPQLDWIPFISASALTGKRVNRLLSKAASVYDSLRRVLGRENVIEWFQKTWANHPHPSTSTGPATMSRCCQVMVNPPALAFEVGHPERVIESYTRYLRKQALDHFGLDGVPIRIWYRSRFQLRTDEELENFLARGNRVTAEEDWSEEQVEE
jgi:GTPase